MSNDTPNACCLAQRRHPVLGLLTLTIVVSSLFLLGASDKRLSLPAAYGQGHVCDGCCSARSIAGVRGELRAVSGETSATSRDGCSVAIVRWEVEVTGMYRLTVTCKGAVALRVHDIMAMCWDEDILLYSVSGVYGKGGVYRFCRGNTRPTCLVQGAPSEVFVLLALCQSDKQAVYVRSSDMSEVASLCDWCCSAPLRRVSYRLTNSGVSGAGPNVTKIRACCVHSGRLTESQVGAASKRQTRRSIGGIRRSGP